MKMNYLLTLFIIINVHSICLAQIDSESNSGRNAPNFLLKNIDGDIIELKNFIGKGPVLLCFWSVCCQSAIAQIKAYSDLNESYKDKGFTMLALSTDNEKTVGKVKPYAKAKKYDFEILYDTDKAVARLYYAQNNPFSVLINNQGKIVYSHLGYMNGDEQELDKKIKSMMDDN